MAANEIRIPVIVDLETQEKKSINKTSANVTDKTKQQDNKILQALNFNFFVGSLQKLTAASGNNVASQVIGEGMKWGTLVVRSLSGDPVAISTAAIELAAEALKGVQELKQNIATNNQVNYNKILNGQTYFGAGQIEASKDWMGRITYNKK